MNDIDELRSHLQHSSPEALERARERVLAAQGRADTSGAAAPNKLLGRTVGQAAPPWRPRQRTTIRLGGLALAAVAVAVLAVLVGIGSGGGGPGESASPLAPAAASARMVLVRAAASAAQANDGGISRLPHPDEYFYLEIRGTYRDGSATDAGTTTQLNTRTYRSWLSQTRPGRIESGSGAPADRTARLLMFIGNERFSYDELQRFDPTPRELYERLLRGISPGQGSSPQAEVFVQLVDALRQVPLPPRLRATFLRALAEIPGLRLTGATKDSLGRPGLAIAYVERSREDEPHEVILSHDGALLAERTVTREGKLLTDALVVRQAITSDLQRPPR